MLATFFYADGRVKRHDVAGFPMLWKVPERDWDGARLEFGESAFDSLPFRELIFERQWFDRHLRVVGSRARWEVYVEQGHLPAVLRGAMAAEMVGRFIAWLGED